MNNISVIRNIMFFINIITCIFIMMIVAFTSSLVCNLSQAAEFLYTTVSIPSNPFTIFYFTLLICAGFILSFSIRHIFFSENKRAIYGSLLFDAFLNILLIYINNCNYSGFILWLLANIIFYVEAKWKYPVLISGLFAYMILNYDLISVYKALFDVKTYVNFYPPHIQKVLFIILSVLSAGNFICFIFFCIQVIKHRDDTIEEKERLYCQLEKANAELRNYADIKERMGKTEERNRIAREIHDTIGHSLTGISVGVDTCLAIIDLNPKAVKEQLEVISSVAKDGIADVRRSVRALQDDEYQKINLEERIKVMLDKASISSGIEINLETDVDTWKFEKDEDNAIFRVIQESVTNSLRYGKPKSINVSIKKIEQNLYLVIKDDGQGCENFTPGFGITHMMERVEMLHGAIDFLTDDGFVVKAVIPLREGL